MRPHGRGRLPGVRRKIDKLLRDRNFSEILTGSIWALGARVMATGLGLVASIIIARWYGAEIVGTVAVIESFFALAMVLALLGTNVSILRLIPEYRAKYSLFAALLVYRKVLSLVVAASLVVAMLFFLGAAPLAALVFAKPHWEFYFALASLFIICRALTMLTTEATRGLRLIRFFAFMQVMPSIGTVALLLLLHWLWSAPDLPVYAVLGGSLLAAVVGVALVEFGFKGQRCAEESVVLPPPLRYRELFAISLPMMMTTAMTFITGQTGVILLGMFRSEAEVGFYAVAVKLATLTSFILSAINSMVAPKFSELYHAGKLDELFLVARQSARLIFWVTTPLIIGLVVLGKPFLYLVFGPDFTVAYPALLLLVAGQFVNSISGSTGFFLNMTGRQLVLRNIMLAAAVLNVSLALLLVPLWGIIGAAMAAMAAMVFWNVTALLYINARFGRTTGYFPGIF